MQVYPTHEWKWKIDAVHIPLYYIKGQTYITQVSMKEDDLHGASVSGDGKADEGEQKNGGRIIGIKKKHRPHIHDLVGESEVAAFFSRS